MTKEYIERASLIGKLTSSETQSAMREMDGSQAYSFFLSLLNAEPTADVVEVKHGRWNCVGQVCIDGEYEDILRCSKCSIPYYRKSRYCPNCGAKMLND